MTFPKKFSRKRPTSTCMLGGKVSCCNTYMLHVASLICCMLHHVSVGNACCNTHMLPILLHEMIITEKSFFCGHLILFGYSPIFWFCNFCFILFSSVDFKSIFCLIHQSFDFHVCVNCHQIFYFSSFQIWFVF